MQAETDVGLKDNKIDMLWTFVTVTYYMAVFGIMEKKIIPRVYAQRE